MNQPHTLEVLLKKLDPAAIDHYKDNYDGMSPSGQRMWTDSERPGCQLFLRTREYSSGDKTYIGYILCCRALKFCKENIASSEAPSADFYKQTWFFCVCGGVGLLLIAIIGVAVFCICRKKKGGSGGDSGSKGKSTGGKKGRKAGGQEEDGIESNGSIKTDCR